MNSSDYKIIAATDSQSEPSESSPLNPVVDKCFKRWKKAICCWAVVCIVATITQLIEYQFIYEHFSHRTAPHYYKGNVYFVSFVSFIAAILTFLRCLNMNYAKRLDKLVMPPFEITASIALIGNLLLGFMIVYDVRKY